MAEWSNGKRSVVQAVDKIFVRMSACSLPLSSLRLRDVQWLPFDPALRRVRRTRPGILLAARSLVSRAGALKGPTSPTYQQRGANMKENKDRFRIFLLLLFLRPQKKVEVRHGAVVAFTLWTRPYCRPLAKGHDGRLSSSTSSSRRVHYSLICTSAFLKSKRAGNDLATRVGTPRLHERGADGPMPERRSI